MMYNDNHTANTNLLKFITVGSDDKNLVYTFEDSSIVVLSENNPTPPVITCNEVSQVYLDFACRDCLTPLDFLAELSDCKGETSNGDNIFVNFEINYLNINLIEPSNSKRRFSFEFKVTDYSYTGTGGGFTNYDLAANLQVTNPPGFTVDIK